MTHLEDLKQATTKEEFANILFEFETDVLYEKRKNKIAGIDIAEWLEKEKRPTETIARGGNNAI